MVFDNESLLSWYWWIDFGFRIALPAAVGVHDPDKMREQQRHAVSVAQHRQFTVPQRIEIGGAPRHSAQHLRQNHPVHRSGKLCLRIALSTPLLDGLTWNAGGRNVWISPWGKLCSTCCQWRGPWRSFSLRSGWTSACGPSWSSPTVCRRRKESHRCRARWASSRPEAPCGLRRPIWARCWRKTRRAVSVCRPTIRTCAKCSTVSCGPSMFSSDAPWSWPICRIPIR